MYNYCNQANNNYQQTVRTKLYVSQYVNQCSVSTNNWYEAEYQETNRKYVTNLYQPTVKQNNESTNAQ